MKLLFLKALRCFLFKSSFGAIALLIFLFTSSCSKTEACEDSNTGTLIIENSRSTGVVKIFFNQEPISGNVSGDLNIKPGEKASGDKLAGQIIIYALLDTSTCSGSQCIIRNETLPERTVDLTACQELNLVY
ncbi:hypothetical protein [Flagellimonas sp.]|uniref:hypothetical protein n=1 Tax=Flagellimonas sp. TaxID=2058762 RepID=UPI003B50D120